MQFDSFGYVQKQDCVSKIQFKSPLKKFHFSQII